MQRLHRLWTHRADADQRHRAQQGNSSSVQLQKRQAAQQHAEINDAENEDDDCGHAKRALSVFLGGLSGLHELRRVSQAPSLKQRRCPAASECVSLKVQSSCPALAGIEQAILDELAKLAL